MTTISKAWKSTLEYHVTDNYRSNADDIDICFIKQLRKILGRFSYREFKCVYLEYLRINNWKILIGLYNYIKYISCNSVIMQTKYTEVMFAT